ncbi:MAG TPA: glycosyltransferase family 2 protein [Candidatus Baltobacteraceae bacterium]|nr:glycosyltransferase family 2 protein [Candidatus Baltobacteraceae bacterium]
MDPADVTAVILTRDEERNLPRALSSLPRGMPVLVIDAASTDGTVAFARAYGARVFERSWTNFVEARRFAIANVETPWLLQLDADEEIDDRLRDALQSAREDVDGYTVSRSTYFCGTPMRMWRGERLLRLVRTSCARIEARPTAGGDAPLHERVTCTGTVADLGGTLLHYSYESSGEYRERFARYTDIEARGLSRSPIRALVASFMVIPHAANNLLRRGALLDGPRGWFVAWFSALYPAVVAWKAILRQAQDDT